MDRIRQMATRTSDPSDNVAQVTIPAPTSAEDLYSFAAAVADCPVHRKQHEEFEARRAEDDAAIDRLDRKLLRQLDLPFSRNARAVSV